MTTALPNPLDLLADTLAATDALLREWWSKLPLFRPVENKPAGKQEDALPTANLLLTDVVGKQGRIPFWEQARWRGPSANGADLQDWLRALLDHAEGAS